MGYGPGPLFIREDIGGEENFIYPLVLSRELSRVTRGQLRSYLTYEWFKISVICTEQSWLCEEVEPTIENDDLEFHFDQYESTRNQFRRL